jgi:hypothetical protein
LNNTDQISAGINTLQTEGGFIASPPTERNSSLAGGRFDLIDDEMVEIHQKFRAFVTYL